MLQLNKEFNFMAVKITKTEQLHFHIKCEYCFCEFDYDQEDLGFRPWYPKGFIYCPKCGKPLRHYPERYLVKNENQ